MARRKVRATGHAKVLTQAIGLEGATFYAAAGQVIEGEEAALKKLMELSGSFEWVDDAPKPAKKSTGKGPGKE